MIIQDLYTFYEVLSKNPYLYPGFIKIYKSVEGSFTIDENDNSFTYVCVLYLKDDFSLTIIPNQTHFTGTTYVFVQPPEGGKKITSLSVTGKTFTGYINYPYLLNSSPNAVTSFSIFISPLAQNFVLNLNQIKEVQYIDDNTFQL